MDDPAEADGARSPSHGTPAPVEIATDIRQRSIWAIFLLGPVTWFAHFMVVYLVAEAGCTGDGPGLTVFDPPVPVALTLIATVPAVTVCAAGAVWGFRRWRLGLRALEAGPDEAEELPDGLAAGRGPPGLAFVGFLLSTFFLVAVLYTAAPATILGPC
ncbi:MAG: hypothetical protein KY469_06900 [Actinobacteria bacterium]|nr:hypothetical protein [Actinomycetota bacterium]